jgi:DNA-binding NarL/FixJ family response regulator
VLGVTSREHEVLRLLAERLGNTEIGRRLYISPRTVEKHVASLLAKSGERDRAALHRFALVHVD